MKRNYLRNKLSKTGKERKWQERGEQASTPEQLAGVYQAMSQEHPEVVGMERKVIWGCPEEHKHHLGELALQIDAPVSASAYSPLVLFLSETEGETRTDQQHRVFIGLEALFFGTLSPGGNARDDDGDFANMQGVGLSPAFVDKRSPEEKEAAAKRKIKREAKKAAKAAAKEAKKAAFESLSPEAKKAAKEAAKAVGKRKRNITQKAWRQPRKDDDNRKRRDARALKKAKVAEALKPSNSRTRQQRFCGSKRHLQSHR